MARGAPPRSVALRRPHSRVLARAARACGKVSPCGAGGQTRLRAGDRSCAGRWRPPPSSASSRSPSARPTRRLPCSTQCSSGPFPVSRIRPGSSPSACSRRIDREASRASRASIWSRCARPTPGWPASPPSGAATAGWRRHRTRRLSSSAWPALHASISACWDCACGSAARSTTTSRHPATAPS